MTSPPVVAMLFSDILMWFRKEMEGQNSYAIVGMQEKR
jgi:hypothetical protein